MEPDIAADISESTMQRLRRQLEELDALLDQTMNHAGNGMSSLTNRLNSMAGNVGSAASGLKDIETTATIESDLTAEGGITGGGSVTVDPSDLDIDGEAAGISGGAVVITPGGGAGGGGIAAGGQVEVDITEGGASGEGSGSHSGSLNASTQITMTTSLDGVAASLSSLSSQMRLLSGEMAGVTGTLRQDMEQINAKVSEISDTAFDLFMGEGDTDLLIDSSEIDIDQITLGKISYSTNNGEIYGDINIGGITGAMAMEYALDPEDDITGDMNAKERRKYEIKAEGCYGTWDVE